jgi:hypothetical protein
MQKQIAAAACGVVLVAVAWTAVPRGADAPAWNPRAAASYLDQRADAASSSRPSLVDTPVFSAQLCGLSAFAFSR